MKNIIIALLLIASTTFAQTNPAAFSGKRVNRIVIRNATTVDGSGKPASGPFDIVVEGDTIKQIVALDPVAVKSGEAKRPDKGDLEIDATGKYVLPGLIDLHAHIHDERGGVPMPVE
jgi:imidazolonepropionase-like amidohydrolase